MVLQSLMVAGLATALRVALCAVLCAVATVESANAAGANASPPQAVTVANTAAAPMRRPVSLLFCFMLTSPFAGQLTGSLIGSFIVDMSIIDMQGVQVSQPFMCTFPIGSWLPSLIMTVRFP